LKKPVIGLLAGMSTRMVAAIIGTCVLCIFVTLKLESGRELPKDFNTLDKRIQESQALVSDYVAAPVLPPLKKSWREVASSLELYGLNLKPDDESASGATGSSYDGPIRHWSGTVTGSATVVLAMIKEIQESEPVYLLDYSVGDGTFKLHVAVVGI
jgi:hypothetical protein